MFCQTGRKSLQCSDRKSGESQWFTSKEAYFPQLTGGGNVLSEVESQQACFALCEEWSKYCILIIYDIRERKCHWYKDSSNQNYQKLSISSTLVAMTKVCPSGKYNSMKGFWKSNITLSSLSF